MAKKRIVGILLLAVLLVVGDGNAFAQVIAIKPQLRTGVKMANTSSTESWGSCVKLS